MPDETQPTKISEENNPENLVGQATPVSESVPSPTASPTSPEATLDEASEPTEPVPTPPIESAPTEVSPEPLETPPNPEEATPVKDDISANEPLPQPNEPIPEPSPTTPETKPEITIGPTNPNITVEKHGTDTTITEVMQPNSAEATTPDKLTAQMGASEPLADWQAEKRSENLTLANETRQEKKHEKINKILTLFSEKPQTTNDEVEKLLHVSDATATRYLDELEKEGKIKQVGKTGKHTHYEKI